MVNTNYITDVVTSLRREEILGAFHIAEDFREALYNATSLQDLFRIHKDMYRAKIFSPDLDTNPYGINRAVSMSVVKESHIFLGGEFGVRGGNIPYFEERRLAYPEDYIVAFRQYRDFLLQGEGEVLSKLNNAVLEAMMESRESVLYRIFHGHKYLLEKGADAPADEDVRRNCRNAYLNKVGFYGNNLSHTDVMQKLLLLARGCDDYYFRIDQRNYLGVPPRVSVNQGSGYIETFDIVDVRVPKDCSAIVLEGTSRIDWKPGEAPEMNLTIDMDTLEASLQSMGHPHDVSWKEYYRALSEICVEAQVARDVKEKVDKERAKENSSVVLSREDRDRCLVGGRIFQVRKDARDEGYVLSPDELAERVGFFCGVYMVPVPVMETVLKENGIDGEFLKKARDSYDEGMVEMQNDSMVVKVDRDTQRSLKL